MRALLAGSVAFLLTPAAAQAVVLTIEPVPANAGRVTSSPPGIDCPSDCTEDLAPQSVSLVAYAPGSGYAIDHWGGCDTTHSDPTACSINLAQARTVQAFWNDVQSPTIIFGGPTGTVSGTILLNPTVSDNSGTVDHVSFYRDRTLPGDMPFALDSDPEGGYTAQFDTTTVPDGDYSFEQIAYDAAGNASAVSRMLTVDNVAADTVVNPPVFVDPSPADGVTTSGGALQYTFTRDGDVPDANVTCRVDSGATAACSSPYTVDVSGLADGGHSLTVGVTDTSGNQASASRTFKVDRPVAQGTATPPSPSPTPTPTPSGPVITVPPLSLSAKRSVSLKSRRLRVTFSTPRSGIATFELLRGAQQYILAQKTVPGGPGTLRLRIPAGVTPGRYRLRLTFDGKTKRAPITLRR